MQLHLDKILNIHVDLNKIVRFVTKLPLYMDFQF